MDIVKIDYNNGKHAKDLIAMLNIYACDNMGGGSKLAENVEKNLAAELAKLGDQAFSLLAYIDQKPVGLANCFMGFSTFKCRPLINIHDIATHPDHRKQGIATALIEEITNIARAKNCCKVTLEVLSQNDKAQKLYSKCGFEGYGQSSGKDGAFFWEKPL